MKICTTKLFGKSSVKQANPLYSFAQHKTPLSEIVIDRNPILYFRPNQNRNQNAVTETESKPKENGKYKRI